MRSLTPHRYESKTLPLQNGSYTAVTLSQQMYCACMSGRHAHVWLHIKDKTPVLEHGCLRWNRTWASLTILGVASLHDVVSPESQNVSLSLKPVNSQWEGALALNSNSVIFILPQCPVCLVRQRFQANIWTHRICSEHRKPFTHGSCTKTYSHANRQTHTCRYLSTVEWIWAVGFKAVPVKEGRQLCAAVL